MQDCTAPQSGPLTTHTSSALCMKGVWCRSGGVPLTAHCSLHCTTERSVGPQVDGEGGHAVVCLCLPCRPCQVPTPPHCNTAPVPQPPQQGLSAALSMFECEGHSVVCVCAFQGREGLFFVREGWEVRVCSPGWSEVRRVEVTMEQSV